MNLLEENYTVSMFPIGQGYCLHGQVPKASRCQTRWTSALIEQVSYLFSWNNLAYGNSWAHPQKQKKWGRDLCFNNWSETVAHKENGNFDCSWKFHPRESSRMSKCRDTAFTKDGYSHGGCWLAQDNMGRLKVFDVHSTAAQIISTAAQRSFCKQWFK